MKTKKMLIVSLFLGIGISSPSGAFADTIAIPLDSIASLANPKTLCLPRSVAAAREVALASKWAATIPSSVPIHGVVNAGEGTLTLSGNFKAVSVDPKWQGLNGLRRLFSKPPVAVSVFDSSGNLLSVEKEQRMGQRVGEIRTSAHIVRISFVFARKGRILPIAAVTALGGTGGACEIGPIPANIDGVHRQDVGYGIDGRHYRIHYALAKIQ